MHFYPHKHTNDMAIASIVKTQESRVMDMFIVAGKELKDKDYLVDSIITVCDYFFYVISFD
jgi:hypothetical protein